MAKVSNNKSSVRKDISVKNSQPLPVVKKCTIEFFYYDRGYEGGVEGDVKFDGNMIVVSYGLEDGGYVVYKGTEKGDGHYELRASSVNGKATLHMFEKSKILEGYRFEEDERGMWRIELL